MRLYQVNTKYVKLKNCIQLQGSNKPTLQPPKSLLVQSQPQGSKQTMPTKVGRSLFTCWLCCRCNNHCINSKSVKAKLSWEGLGLYAQPLQPDFPIGSTIYTLYTLVYNGKGVPPPFFFSTHCTFLVLFWVLF